MGKYLQCFFFLSSDTIDSYAYSEKNNLLMTHTSLRSILLSLAKNKLHRNEAQISIHYHSRIFGFTHSNSLSTGFKSNANNWCLDFFVWIYYWQLVSSISILLWSGFWYITITFLIFLFYLGCAIHCKRDGMLNLNEKESLSGTNKKMRFCCWNFRAVGTKIAYSAIWQTMFKWFK